MEEKRARNYWIIGFSEFLNVSQIFKSFQRSSKKNLKNFLRFPDGKEILVHSTFHFTTSNSSSLQSTLNSPVWFPKLSPSCSYSRGRGYRPRGALLMITSCTTCVKNENHFYSWLMRALIDPVN